MTAHALSLQLEAARVEHPRVELVLREFGLAEHIPAMINRHGVLYGEPRLSFEVFDEFFPGFPICLGARPLYRLAEHSTCSQTAMFKDFRDHVAYDAFQEFRQEAASRARGRPVGLLYRWEGIKHGLVLHDGEFPTTGFKQIFSERGERMTIEHFGRLVKTLAASSLTLKDLRTPWEPPPATSPPKTPPTPWQLSCRVSNWEEHQILALLMEILVCSPPSNVWSVVTRHDGHRWVVLPQEHLAQRLGRSVRTIQRAVSSLRSKGLIETESSESKHMMRISPEIWS